MGGGEMRRRNRAIGILWGLTSIASVLFFCSAAYSAPPGIETVYNGLGALT